MRLVDSQLFVSATDLSNFLSCRHRTALELAEAHGARKRPRFDDPFLEILIQRGREHEKAYVESLRTGVRRVVDLSDEKLSAALPLTLDALRSGADVVVQAALSDGRWSGRPDVLLRVPAAGGFGDRLQVRNGGLDWADVRPRIMAASVLNRPPTESSCSMISVA